MPIAVVKLRPDALKYGTENVPPPIPSNDDKNPITEPAKIDLGLFGVFLDVIFDIK